MASVEAGPNGIEPGTKLSVDDVNDLIDSALDAMPTVHLERETKRAENGIAVTETSIGDFQREPEAFRGKVTLKEPGDQSVVELVAVGEATYVKTDGPKWVKNDRALSRTYLSKMPWPFTEVDLAMRSPGLGGTTVYVGQEEIDGAELARYSFGFEEPIAGDMNKGRVNGWFDAEGRLIRLHVTVIEGSEIAMDFSKHGEKLTITAPRTKDIESPA